MHRSSTFVAGVVVGLVFTGEARADDSLRLSAKALAFGGAFVGAKVDAAAPLLQPAALGASATHLGGSLGYASLDQRGDGFAGFPRGAVTYRFGSLAFGGGLAARGYDGRGVRDAAEYEANLAAAFTVFEGPEGDRLAFGLALRPRLARLRLEDFRGFVFGPLGVAAGVTYAPLEELSFGFLVESGGTASGTLEDRRSSPGTPRRASAELFTAPSLAWGVEFELDRWTARLDYRLELTSLEPRLTVGAANPSAPPSGPPDGFEESVRVGAERGLAHSVALGLEHRFSVGRSELPLRFGLGFASENDGLAPDVWTRSVTPRGSLGVGLGFVMRQHEFSLGTSLSTNLGDATVLVEASRVKWAVSTMTLALDWTYRFGR